MKQYSFSKSIVLHLLPGALGTLAFIFLAPIFLDNGYPSILALFVALSVFTLPLELGYLFLQRHNAENQPVIELPEPLPKWQYILFPLGMVIWGFLASGALSFWIGLVINGFVAPIVEEFYFRGHLLPRLSGPRNWVPFINISLFFALSLLDSLAVLFPYYLAFSVGIYYLAQTKCLLDDDCSRYSKYTGLVVDLGNDPWKHVGDNIGQIKSQIILDLAFDTLVAERSN